jgi:hypothetical protein
MLVPMNWLLLIYVVPSEPSRKRAAVWRDLKKAGAVYLRDGVAVLPQRAETLATFQRVANRIADFGGQATLVEDARLDPEREAAIVAEARAARTAEFEEIGRDVEGFLDHIARERAHREFTFTEVEELEADLIKLKRWTEQVRARDYYDSAAGTAVDALLARGEAELGTFLDDTFEEAGS